MTEPSRRPRACSDFARTTLLHKAAAEAGRGLPAIEPGMPMPAGTGLDRRTFLSSSLGAALAVYGASKLSLPGLDEGIARAATTPTSRVLLSVFLAGGADSLSLLAPLGDPRYKALRPRLGLAQSSIGPQLAADPRLFWHPSLAPFATLFAERKVAVLPAVGYTNANQSHFTSRHYWEVGATQATLRSGWLGRYLDYTGIADNPLQGLSLDPTLAPTLAPDRVPVASLGNPDGYSLWTPGIYDQPVADRLLSAVVSFGSSPDPALNTAAAVAAQSVRVQRQLAPVAQISSGTIRYPDGDFGKSLSVFASILGAGLPVRCAAITAPGQFDTHANQEPGLTDALAETANGLFALQRDLEARGLADRVLIHVWSEFGRRAAENASNGTDHGAAGTGFLIGTRVRGSLIGEFPGLTTGLDSLGNLKATADFRGLYAALLEQWLGVDAAAVLPSVAGFSRPQLLK